MDWNKLLKKLPAKWVPIAILLVWGAFWGIGIKLGFHRKPMFTFAIIVTIIILLVWIVLIIIAIRKLKQEENAKRMADAASAGSSRIKNLEEKLLFAIKALRESKIGKDVGKADAQYAVPWYMLIGPTGSGKTSLLTRSGLDFRLRDPSANELTTGTTRDCNWLFANEAVVMDTAGRYVSQTDKSLDNAEWLSLLDHLKRHRRIKPLDGLVVAIDISRILSAREDEIEREAQNIRDRLDSIVGQLGVNLPVYLVFTKCDMIQGFADFFNSLSKENRDQIFGSSFTAQQQNNIVTAFKEEWTILCDSLRSQVNVILTPETERQQRRGIYLFPKQLEVSFGKVNHFVSTLFRPSTYLDRPALQGFYLTSGLQEASPVDLVMGDIEKNYNIRISSPATSAPESRSFFVRDMLLKAVFPSQGFVNPTAKAQRKALMRWLVPLAIEFVVLGLIIMGIAFSFTGNENLLSRSDTVAKGVAGMGATVIPPGMLSDLQKQINDLRSFHIFPWRGQRHKVAKALEKRFFIEVPFKVVKDPGGKEKPKDLYNVIIYEESQPNEQVKTDKSGEATLKAFKGNNVSQVRIALNYQEAGFGIDRAKVETDKGQSELLLFEPVLMLAAGENYRKVSISYAKLRVLTVQVYDDKKSPIPGVPVSITDPTIPTPFANSFSDDTGAARLEFRAKDNSVLNVDFAESGISFPGTMQLRIDPGKYDYALEEAIRTKPPVFNVAIESPSDNFTTKEDTITVKGKISAVSKNASTEGLTVQVGNQLVPVLAGNFSFDYPLKNGKNEIGITVMSSSGQLLSQTMVKKGVKAVAAAGGGGVATTGTGGTTQQGTSQTNNTQQVVVPTSNQTSNTNTQGTNVPAKPQVAKIEINPPTVKMKPGEQKVFTAIAYDSSNNPIPNVDLTWSVAGDVGQIDRSGAFTARKSGSGQVTVASGNAKDSSAVTIGEAMWKIISTQNKDLKHISFVDNNTGWAVGYPMLIAKTTDGGQSWQYQIDGSSGNVTLGDGTTFGADKLKAALKSVCFIGTADKAMGWAVGEKGIILYSPDGTKWVSQTSYIDETLEGVYFVDANKGWAVGRNGTILITNNGGAKWNKQAYRDNTAFYGVFFLDPSKGWIIGQNGTILTTTNGGSQWSIQMDPKLKSYLRDVFFISPSKGWLVGTEGLIMSTTNGGNSWSVQTSKTINNLFGIRFTNENEGWAVGEGGLILRTSDGGKNWTETRVGAQNFLGISGTNAGGVWAIGARGTIASFTF